MTAVEVRAAQREVAAHGLGRGTAERHDPLLVALAEHAHDARVEVDGRLLQPERLRHAQPGAVEQLHQRAIAHRPRLRAVRRLDQPLGLGRGQGAGQRSRPPRRLQGGGRVLVAVAEQDLMAEVRAHGRQPPCDGRRGEPVRPHRGEPTLELLGRRGADRVPEEGAEGGEVAAVGVDRAWRTARREEQEVPLDVVVGVLRHGRLIRVAGPPSCPATERGAAPASFPRRSRPPAPR